MKKLLVFIVSMLLFQAAWAQETGEIRGFVLNKSDGTPLPYVSLKVVGQSLGALTDEKGYYSIANVPAGDVTIMCWSIGFDTVYHKLNVRADRFEKANLYLSPSSYKIAEVQVSAARIERKKETKISEIKITPRQIKSLPSMGGEPDLVQYLQVLPGVVFTGDQGGQLYIRGGSPVMNKVLLDGMTIYNPFHSIGLFSVFDADIIQSADVYSAGFGAEYGGRVSAIVDVKTLSGNSKELAGKVSVNPFVSKLLVEGPLRKFKADRGFTSFILTYKNSYLDKSSPKLYPYAGDGQLPYSFSDLYGKLSMHSTEGSYIDIFGFDYNDRASFANSTSYEWGSSGFGTEFLVVPGNSKTLIDGNFAYSKYLMEQQEVDNRPRESGIDGFNLGLNFNYYIGDNELNYGIEANGFSTNFQFFNSSNRLISQEQNTTEFGAYIRTKQIIKDKLIIEPGLRYQRYSSLQTNSWEPRLRFKYNMTDRFRIKGAGGYYSQNLLSAVSDRDVVNLFYGFLSGPSNLPKTFDGQEVTHKLQKARHAVLGVEFDLNLESEINVEGYVKDFTQITNINRDKIFDDNKENSDQPDFLKKDYIIERGLAYGFDVTYKFNNKHWYIWLVYSYNNVSRYDGVRTYQPHFDRRHNVNVLGQYMFGKDEAYELSLRWNYGSGFPFTKTQGYYELIDFGDGISTDYLTENGDLAVLYGDLNTGRLPDYHRMDFSAKRHWEYKNKKEKNREVEITLSITNVYNRENIFYFDRIRYTRVNQLPVIPSLAASYKF